MKLVQLLPVFRGVLHEGVCVRGIYGRKPSGYLIDCDLHPDRIEPEVRIMRSVLVVGVAVLFIHVVIVIVFMIRMIVFVIGVVIVVIHVIVFVIGVVIIVIIVIRMIRMIILVIRMVIIVIIVIHMVILVIRMVIIVIIVIRMIILVIRMVIVVIGMIIVHVVRELDGIDKVAKRDYPGLIRAGAVQQIVQPIGLQAETDSEHDIRIRHPGNVARSRLE